MVIASLPFNNLFCKTQVLPATMTIGSPITRMVHCKITGVYSELAGSFLGLNAGLCRVGGETHDLGHYIFGHGTEVWLKKLLDRFVRHAVVGAVILDQVEQLNVTDCLLDAIARHARPNEHDTGAITLHKSTSEAPLIMHIDEICCSFCDAANFRDSGIEIDRAVLSEIEKQTAWFGQTVDERIKTCIAALCIESAEHGRVFFDKSEIAEQLFRLKTFLYENVYYPLKMHEKIAPILEKLCDFFLRLFPDCDPVILLNLLTDINATRLAEASSDSEFLAMIDKTPLTRYIPILRGKKFDVTNPYPYLG